MKKKIPDEGFLPILPTSSKKHSNSADFASEWLKSTCKIPSFLFFSYNFSCSFLCSRTNLLFCLALAAAVPFIL